MSWTLTCAVQGEGDFVARHFLVDRFNSNSVALGAFVLKLQLQKFLRHKRWPFRHDCGSLHGPPEKPSPTRWHPAGCWEGEQNRPHAMQGRTVFNTLCGEGYLSEDATKATTWCLLPRVISSNRSIQPGLPLSSEGAAGCLTQWKRFMKSLFPAHIGKTASGSQTGLVRKRAKPKRMSYSSLWLTSAAPDSSLRWVDAFYSCEVWKMLLFLEDPHRMQLPPCLALSLPPYQWVWTTTLQPNTTSLGEPPLQVVPWLTLIFLLLNLTNYTFEHKRSREKNWMQTRLQLSPRSFNSFPDLVFAASPAFIFSHQSGVDNEDRICILPPARVFLVQISCLWLE